MSAIDALICSPASHEWETPSDLFAVLDVEFSFTLDAAANHWNHKVDRYYGIGGIGINGLQPSWKGEIVWLNPPYGRYIGAWVEKGRQESLFGATVVMLIPARTDTAYWHDHVMRALEIRFIAGRLRFSGAADNAPFPSAVVVFRPGGYQGPPVISTINRDGSQR